LSHSKRGEGRGINKSIVNILGRWILGKKARGFLRRVKGTSLS
jgi:hypothetical protein